MSNFEQELRTNFDSARKIFEPLIVPYIKEYVEPPQNIIDSDLKNQDNHALELAKNSLLVSKSSTPKIENILNDVCKNLNINRSLIQAFIFPKMDIEAFAIINTFPITVGLSAGTVSRLSKQELMFVIGHEIGHGIIGSIINFNENSKSIEDMIFARGLEISADRIGLIAVRNIEVAARTILKVLSGLDDEYLDYDIAKLLEENQSVILDENDQYSSHPPLLMRISFLYHLSITKEYLELTKGKETNSLTLETVNKQLTQTLESSVDKIA